MARIVRGWWVWHDLGNGDRESRVRLERGEGTDVEEAWAARSAVTEALRDGGLRAVELVQALSHAATDDSRIATLAAGAVGTLVSDHGIDLAHVIADAAAQDPRFAEVLQYAWVLDGHLDEPSRQVLLPWIPHLDQVTVRGPIRSRPKGRRWKDRSVERP